MNYKEKVIALLNSQELSKEQKEKLEGIFPELAESEDEKIMGKIIGTIHLYYGEPLEDEAKEMITWIEKQGEHANFRNKIQIGDKVTRNEGGVLVNISQLNRIAKKRKNQGKHKIEPKFKVGDWVCHSVYKKPLQIVEDLGGGDYRVEPNSIITEKEFREHIFRKWNIADAKPGDVLACADDGRPFIFKGLLDKFHQQAPVAYCGIDCDDEFTIPPGLSWWADDEVYPATKEQRDLLFKKMHEAGYEWDAEKKELKKIEQKPSKNKGMNLKEEEMTPFQKEVFYIIDTTIEAEIGLKQECDILLALASNEIKQQPSWSEEDEKMLDDTIGAIGAADYYTYDAKQEIENWLKSIKARYTWKPSDEQMDVLKKACDEHWEPDGLDPLYTLYQDLKKLREE